MNTRTPKRRIALQGLVALCWIAGLVALGVQWRLISQLRRDNDALRVQRQRPADKESRAAPAVVASDLERLRTEKEELLRLRNEVRQLREQVALLTNKAWHAENSQLQITPSIHAPSREDGISQLALAASRGDFTALDKLAELSATAHARFRTNQDAGVFAEFRLAFDRLGTAAGKGDETAFQALWRATRLNSLEGFAIQALGQAAGLGNEKALELLLDPERYLLTRSSTVGALKPAADSGNRRAIESLAAVVADPKSRALWFLVSEGLQQAAIRGNAIAIDALATVGRSENPSVRKSALRGLENAAFNQHLSAIEALRNLGYQ